MLDPGVPEEGKTGAEPVGSVPGDVVADSPCVFPGESVSAIELDCKADPVSELVSTPDSVSLLLFVVSVGVVLMVSSVDPRTCPDDAVTTGEDSLV